MMEVSGNERIWELHGYQIEIKQNKIAPDTDFTGEYTFSYQNHRLKLVTQSREISSEISRDRQYSYNELMTLFMGGT